MIDLHIHTTYSSDGQYSPAEIISLAPGCGITALAFCDHMDIRAAEEGVILTGGSPLEFLTGVELSAALDGKEYHLLCYGFDPADRVMSEFIAVTCERIWGGMDKVIDFFHAKGFTLRTEDIQGWGRSVPTGVTMLNALLAGNPDDRRLLRYTKGDRSDSPYLNFYSDFSLSDFGRTVSSGLPPLTETIRKFKDSGVLVLAHPGNISVHLLEELMECGLRGIEVYSSHHGPETVSYLKNLAGSLGLFASAGSDFHGDKIKPDIALGSVSGSPDEGLMEAVGHVMAGWRN